MSGRRDKCTWKEDDANDWDTECGHTFMFNDGGPNDNRFAFCPYCGRQIAEKAWEAADAAGKDD